MPEQFPAALCRDAATARFTVPVRGWEAAGAFHEQGGDSPSPQAADCSEEWGRAVPTPCLDRKRVKSGEGMANGKWQMANGESPARRGFEAGSGWGRDAWEDGRDACLTAEGSRNGKDGKHGNYGGRRDALGECQCDHESFFKFFLARGTRGTRGKGKAGILVRWNGGEPHFPCDEGCPRSGVSAEGRHFRSNFWRRSAETPLRRG